jgi:hypothetical protein
VFLVNWVIDSGWEDKLKVPVTQGDVRFHGTGSWTGFESVLKIGFRKASVVQSSDKTANNNGQRQVPARFLNFSTRTLSCLKGIDGENYKSGECYDDANDGIL